MIFLASQSTIIAISVVVFLLVILTLVSILLFAKKKLMPSGEVKININDGDRYDELNQHQHLSH